MVSVARRLFTDACIPPRVILQGGCGGVCAVFIRVTFSSYTLRLWKGMLLFEPFAHPHSCTHRDSLSLSLSPLPHKKKKNAQLQQSPTRRAELARDHDASGCSTSKRLTLGLCDTHDEDTGPPRHTCADGVYIFCPTSEEGEMHFGLLCCCNPPPPPLPSTPQPSSPPSSRL